MVKKKDRYKITVLGAGSWGITLANVLHENGHTLTLWEYDAKQASKLEKYRNFISLKGYKIPSDIEISSSLENVMQDCEYVIVAVPSSALSNVAQQLSKLKFSQPKAFISVIKGFDQKTLKRPTETLRYYLGPRAHIGVLSGPSHAEEVINQVPTALVVASANQEVKLNIQKLFSNWYFRLYTSFDVKGVELGGALKNVIAVGSGITSGLKMGDNTRAALITRGNAEIMRLGHKLGAKNETFAGLSGIGDLIVTCFSEHSRNFRFGKYIGMGMSLEQAFEKVETTVEGYYAARCCYQLANKNKEKMPVSFGIYDILYRGKACESVWRELMLRPLKSESL